jgi:hypothetical protein
MDIEILDASRLRYWCAQIDLPLAAVDELSALARAICADESALAWFRAFHQKTVVQGEWHRSWASLPFDAGVQTAFGARASLVYYLAYLSALPYAEHEYLRRGIGLDVFRATMRDLRTWLVHEFDLDGRWSFRQFSWVWRHLSCELFRLGRMQYMLAPFEGLVHAFRNVASGEIVLLAAPEVALRADGYALGAGSVRPTAPFYRERPVAVEPAWQPSFTAGPDGWRGSPLAPVGFALKSEIFLPRAKWTPALEPGDIVLDMHIPRKEPFSAADCRDSLAQACVFFKQQYPQRPFRAGYCHTWFFTPQLQHILPPESNIVRFQREFYLYPFPGSPAFLWDYVFGEKVTSLAAAPRDTALRRGVLDWLEAGGELFDLAGVMFHGPEEWGRQLYMRSWEQRRE